MTTAAAGPEVWDQQWGVRRPLATDDLARGCSRMSRPDAIVRRYLEHSAPAFVGMLVIDVDHDDALIRAVGHPRSHPDPSWVAETPASGRGHVGFFLSSPVCRTDNARQAPLQYAARVEAGLRRSLGGDLGYTGPLTKNPLHPDWHTTWGTGRAYELDDLARALGDLLPRTLPRRAAQTTGLGRNVMLFDGLRRWAYPAWRRYDDRVEWEGVVHACAVNINAEFPVPLPVSEVAATARSVARWVWRNFSDERFSALQAARGRRGGLANTPAQQAASRRRRKLDHDEALRELL